MKHAMIVTPKKNNTLWETKVIGDHCPLVLPRAVFYYIGKRCCDCAIVIETLKINSNVLISPSGVLYM